MRDGGGGAEEGATALCIWPLSELAGKEHIYHDFLLISQFPVPGSIQMLF